MDWLTGLNQAPCLNDKRNGGDCGQYCSQFGKMAAVVARTVRVEENTEDCGQDCDQYGKKAAVAKGLPSSDVAFTEVPHLN